MYPIEVYLARFSFSNSSMISFVRFYCLNSSFRTCLVIVLLERIEPVVALAGGFREDVCVACARRFAVKRRVLVLVEWRESGWAGASAVKSQGRESGCWIAGLSSG